VTLGHANQIRTRSGLEGRLARLRVSVSELHADALLVSHLANIRYLCGFSGSAGLLLVRGSKTTLFTDSRYTFQAREEVTGAEIRIAKKGILRELGKALRGQRRRVRVAYSSAHIAVAEKQSLETIVGGGVRWVPDENVVEKLRAVKDAEELSTIGEAAVLISEIFRRVIPLIRPGVSELEIASEIESRVKRGGGSGVSFETIVASGPRSAWAHARPTPKLLSKGELVVLDQGAIMRGYCSDMTRTVHVGRASAKAKSLYHAVLDAQQAAKQAIRPGATAGEVDKAARASLKSSKLDRYFTHSTGHGLGLEVHEMPRLGKGEGTVLRGGMVITVEPGVYLEDFGGIRIEDDVVVTATGYDDLTTAPRDFLEL
jgi:Xaa-Pro aminopeptidase